MEVRTLWPDLEGVDAVLMRERLMGVLPDLVRPHYEAAMALASDWYTDARPKSAPAFKLQMAEELGDARLRSMVGESLAPLFEPGTNRNFTWAQERTEGLIETVVLGGFRETIQRTSELDSAAEWWERVVSPGHCTWCQKFAGERYHKAGQFQSHHHCRCTNAPHFAQKWHDLDAKREKAEEAKRAEAEAKAKAEAEAERLAMEKAKAEVKAPSGDDPRHANRIAEIMRLYKSGDLEGMKRLTAMTDAQYAEELKAVSTATDEAARKRLAEDCEPIWGPAREVEAALARGRNT